MVVDMDFANPRNNRTYYTDALSIGSITSWATAVTVTLDPNKTYYIAMKATFDTNGAGYKAACFNATSYEYLAQMGSDATSFIPTTSWIFKGKSSVDLCVINQAGGNANVNYVVAEI